MRGYTERNVKPKMVTFLEENIGKNIRDLGWGKDFFDTDGNHDPQSKILINWILLKLRSSAP